MNIAPGIFQVDGSKRLAEYDMRKREIVLRPRTETVSRVPQASRFIPARVARWPLEREQLKLLTLHLQSSSDPQYVATLLDSAVLTYRCLTFVLVVEVDAIAIAEQAVDRLLMHGVAEIDTFGSEGFLPVAETRFRSYRIESAGNGVLDSCRRAAQQQRMSIGALCVDPALYRLLQHWSVDLGCLVMSPSAGTSNCSTGPFGSSHPQDWVHAGSINDALRSEVIGGLWSAHPDRVDGCRQCEFRYACRNSRVHRSDPTDPCSAPANCDLHPAFR